MDKNYKCSFFEFSEEDVMDAMKSMEGFIDITTGTFREIYELAYQHAVKRMLGTMPVKNIMTSPVHCISEGMGVSDAAAFLAKHNISGAPVTDSGGKISGVVSEKDFLRKMGFDIEPSFMGVISRCLNTSGCMVSGLRNILLSELVSSPAVTVLEDASVSEVSSVFIEKSINRIPVCDINGLPVGIVTRSDLVNAICLQG